MDVAGVICQSNNTSGNLSTSSISSVPTPTSAHGDQNNNNNVNNNAPGNQSISVTTGDQTNDSSLGQSITMELPNYLIALALFVGLLLAIA